MRIFNFLLALVFLIFAFLKINHPQPIPGILMYGTMAVICIMAMFEVYVRWLIMVMFIPVIFYLVSVHEGTREWIHSGGDARYTEDAYDFLMLLLCLAALLFQGFRSLKKA